MLSKFSPKIVQWTSKRFLTYRTTSTGCNLHKLSLSPPPPSSKSLIADKIGFFRPAAAGDLKFLDINFDLNGKFRRKDRKKNDSTSSIYVNPLKSDLYIDAPGHSKSLGVEYVDPSTMPDGHWLDLGIAQKMINEISDPALNGLANLHIDLPTIPTSSEMSCGGGQALIARHKSMKKHWRKKHFRRDIVIFRKRERKRKMAAEKIFRDRLTENIREAETFDAKRYVEHFLNKVAQNQATAAAKKDISKDLGQQSDNNEKKSPDDEGDLTFLDPEFSKLTFGYDPDQEPEKPTSAYDPDRYDPNPDFDGTKKHKVYTHWTELITVEQLFGLPESTYIDKRAARPDQEEWEKILEQRRLYEQNFRKFFKNDGKNEEKSPKNEKEAKNESEVTALGADKV